MFRYKVAIISTVLFIICCFFYVAMYMQPISITTLSDDWHYYEQQLVTNTNVRESPLVQLPYEFKDDNIAYATFVKELTFSQEQIGDMYAFHMPYQYSAAALYIDGKLVAQAGVVGQTAAQHKTSLQSQLVPFEIKAAQMTIAVQISSFAHIRAGFANPLQVGTYSDMSKVFMLERLVIMFLAGFIFLAGMMTLLIGLYKRDERMYFISGLFCLCIALRTLFAVPFLYTLLPIDISYVLATRLEYLTTILAFLLYVMFIAQIYQTLFARWLMNLCYIVAAVVVAAILLTEPLVFQQVFFNIFPVIALVIVYVCYIVLKARMQKLTLALPLLIGIAFVFVGLVIDFLSGMGLAYFPPMSLFTIAANVAIVISSLSVQYVRQTDVISSLNEELTFMNQSLNELVEDRTKKLAIANDNLVYLAEHDDLTGVYNRRKLDEVLQQLIDTEQTNVALLLIDLDEFKKYNDYYGHLQGDAILVEFVRIVQSFMPLNSTFARYGGEEFVIIVQDINAEKAILLAEAIRAAVAAAKIEHVHSQWRYVTVSIGIATCERVPKSMPLYALVEKADEQLYISKDKGRNCISAIEVFPLT